MCSKGLRAHLHASSGICRSVLFYLQVKHSEKIARDLGYQGTFRNRLDLAVVDCGKHSSRYMNVKLGWGDITIHLNELEWPGLGD